MGEETLSLNPTLSLSLFFSFTVPFQLILFQNVLVCERALGSDWHDNSPHWVDWHDREWALCDLLLFYFFNSLSKLPLSRDVLLDGRIGLVDNQQHYPSRQPEAMGGGEQLGRPLLDRVPVSVLLYPKKIIGSARDRSLSATLCPLLVLRCSGDHAARLWQWID